jgi:hypothetical protein
LVRRRDRYLYNTQYSQKVEIHAPAGFKDAIPASERPQSQALERAAAGIGIYWLLECKYIQLEEFFYTKECFVATIPNKHIAF